KVLRRPLRHHGTDALDESGSEILLDTCNSRWNQGLVADDSELLSELRVSCPLAGEIEHLSWYGCHETSHCGDEFTETLYLQASNGETIFLVVKRHPFNLSLDILKHRRQSSN